MFNMIPLRDKRGRLVNPPPKPKADSGADPNENDAVLDVASLPKCMDVYWKPFSEFVPEGVDFDSLSEQEQKLIKNKYRFAFLRPGEYQAITGIGGQNGQMYP